MIEASTLADFNNAAFITNQFFSTQLSSDILCVDLINLYRIIYNYKNAQKCQKVFQLLSGIVRANLPEKIVFYKNQVKEFDFLVSRRNFDAKKENGVGIEGEEFAEMCYGLSKVISLFVDELGGVVEKCEKCFLLSREKIVRHGEFVNYHLLSLSIVSRIRSIIKTWSSQLLIILNKVPTNVTKEYVLMQLLDNQKNKQESHPVIEILPNQCLNKISEFKSLKENSEKFNCKQCSYSLPSDCSCLANTRTGLSRVCKINKINKGNFKRRRANCRGRMGKRSVTLLGEI